MIFSSVLLHQPVCCVALFKYTKRCEIEVIKDISFLLPNLLSGVFQAIIFLSEIIPFLGLALFLVQLLLMTEFVNNSSLTGVVKCIMICPLQAFSLSVMPYRLQININMSKSYIFRNKGACILY